MEQAVFIPFGEPEKPYLTGAMFTIIRSLFSGWLIAVIGLAGPVLLPGQPLVPAAAANVLLWLKLPDPSTLRERLQTDNGRIREQCLTIDGNDCRLLPEGGLDDDRTLYFSLLYLSYYGKGDAGLNQVKNWLARQDADGFIPATSAESGRPVAPLLAQIALLGSKQRTHFTWLLDRPGDQTPSYYERLQRYLDYWFAICDADGNGLPAWTDGSLFMPSQTNTPVESVELICYLHREFRAMALLAHQLRRPEDVAAFRQRADTLAARLNASLWDEQTGFYYDRDEVSGTLLFRPAAAGFLPLYAGIAPYARAERLVREHLQNREEFQPAWPVPAQAGQPPAPVWIPLNYMIVQGLMDYGYREPAKELAGRSFAMTFQANSVTCARYDATTGRGAGPAGGWSALACLLPWEYELNYTPSTLSWQPLLRLAPEYLGVGW